MHVTRIANLLGALSLAVTERLTAEVSRAAGVSVSGASALVTLHTEAGIGITELGARVGLSQPAAVRMVDALTVAGLAERRSRPGRGVEVHLTPAGNDAVRQVLERREDVLARLLDPVGDERLRAMVPGLEAVLAGLVENRRSEFVLCRLCDRDACVADGDGCPVGQACRRVEAGDG